MRTPSDKELCVKWFNGVGVKAYIDDTSVYIILDNEDKTDVLISQAEIDYRAELQKGVSDGNS